MDDVAVAVGVAVDRWDNVVVNVKTGDGSTVVDGNSISVKFASSVRTAVVVEPSTLEEVAD